MKYPFYIIAILGLLIIGGCQESQEKQSALTIITSENLETIAGMQWILLQMTVDGKPVKMVGEKPFIQFDVEENRVTGFASLNRFFGSVNIDKAGNGAFPVARPLWLNTHGRSAGADGPGRCVFESPAANPTTQ
jgi:hypothetical protein